MEYDHHMLRPRPRPRPSSHLAWATMRFAPIRTPRMASRASMESSFDARVIEEWRMLLLGTTTISSSMTSAMVGRERKASKRAAKSGTSPIGSTSKYS